MARQPLSLSTLKADLSFPLRVFLLLIAADGSLFPPVTYARNSGVPFFFPLSSQCIPVVSKCCCFFLQALLLSLLLQLRPSPFPTSSSLISLILASPSSNPARVQLLRSVAFPTASASSLPYLNPFADYSLPSASSSRCWSSLPSRYTTPFMTLSLAMSTLVGGLH